MAEIIWTENALSDIDALIEYISKDSIRYAELFASRIFKAVEQLEKFPESGRIVPEIGDDDLREIIYGSYRIIYRRLKKSDNVEILTIHHGAMLLYTSRL